MSSIDSGSMGAYVSSVASYNSQNMGNTGKADAASSSEKHLIHRKLQRQAKSQVYAVRQ